MIILETNGRHQGGQRPRKFSQAAGSGPPAIPDGLMRLAQPVLSRTLKRQFNQHVNTLKRIL